MKLKYLFKFGNHILIAIDKTHGAISIIASLCIGWHVILEDEQVTYEMELPHD